MARPAQEVVDRERGLAAPAVPESSTGGSSSRMAACSRVRYRYSSSGSVGRGPEDPLPLLVVEHQPALRAVILGAAPPPRRRGRSTPAARRRRRATGGPLLRLAGEIEERRVGRADAPRGGPDVVVRHQGPDVDRRPPLVPCPRVNSRRSPRLARASNTTRSPTPFSFFTRTPRVPEPVLEECELLAQATACARLETEDVTLEAVVQEHRVAVGGHGATPGPAASASCPSSAR